MSDGQGVVAGLQEDVELLLVQGSVKGAMREADAKSRDLWQVSPDKLKVIPNFNVRSKNEGYFAHIRTLADSMLVDGYYQDKPLAGYVAKEGGENVIYIYDGHCRLQGVLLAISEGAEIPRVPVVVNTEGVSPEDLNVALVRSSSSMPLAPYEIAVVCKRLARFGWDDLEIAKRLQLSVQYIQNLLFLMAAPLAVRQLVIDGKVSAKTAIQALKDHGTKAIEVLNAALETSVAAGKTKVTARHVAAKPGQLVARAAKKAAPAMFATLTKVQEDPAFLGLAEETRATIAELVERVKAAEQEAANAGAGETGNPGEGDA